MTGFEGINAEVLETNSSLEQVDTSRLDEKVRATRNASTPKTGGKWSGEDGNSTWIPDRNVEPRDKNGTNPEHKTWDIILDQYKTDGIPFKDDYPDFSDVAKGEVSILDFSDDRSLNFAQADEALAEKHGCSPEDVEKWRKENRYTWHECQDCQTMQKVPTEIHGNIPHSGGISVFKSQNR